ncbi:unnamed protein product, partial [Enterobius vermicularis]|uniref:Myosin motor domain-containing protein n=1 Tax=Enterobius vermicularis TaxID=51028 RepID=A0A0N4VD64_ENTVE
KPYDSKKNVWIPDKEEGYVAADIKSTKGDIVTVVVNGQEKQVKKDLVHQMNPPKLEKTEDMSNLTFLNDASVLHNLRARYSEMLIYTYSGLFCVVINPYKRLPIYTDSVAQMYMGKRRTEMPPHLFAVSDEAYRNMLQNHENQSMLITGESGAGKTENTKKVIAYFASVGASQQILGISMTPKTDKKKVTLEDQIVQTNPVLEAFGNARTVRNNNSSRFGKFIRIMFSKHGKVASCDIEHYLLEKSRVIRQAPGERCYHIFYQMTSDYKPELKPLLKIDKPLKDYYFVAQAELTVDGMNDAEEFQLTDEAFDILHFTPEEKLNCYKLMAAHMHLGNTKYKQRPREEQAEPDGTDEAEKAAEMYGVAVDDLLKAFTHPRVRVGTEWVNKGQNVDQVTWAVGAMGKAVYGRVFNWIVKKCNITLDQKGIPRDYFIGVLDIAGFEIFDFNSFEQLWINFVNEKLQQFFNHHMFILEQEEYAREGIEWKFIDFGLDLQACIELIEKPLGIISMLDEECIVPKATDMTLAQKLNEQHLGKHPNFEKPKPPKGKQAEAHFAMRHYAGLVRYNVTNWLEKNKDPLNDTVAACLKESKGNKLLNEIWADYVTQEEASSDRSGTKKKGKSGSFMTVSMLYRESLNNLMTMLYKTQPHFIRCIIPNEKKKSGLLDASLVLNQLTCNGVLEGIRICRKGFPNRTLHADFKERYALLAAVESKSSEDATQCCTAMLARLVKEGSIKEEHFRIGHTKIFFKAGVVAHLEDLRDEKLSILITGLQAQIRTFYRQIEFAERKKLAMAQKCLQKNIKLWIHLRTWDWFKLYGRVKPLLKAGKVQEEMEKLQEKVVQLESSLSEEGKRRQELEEVIAKANAERDSLLAQLADSKTGTAAVEDRLAALQAAKAELERNLTEVNDRLSEQENRTSNVTRDKKRVEEECDKLKRSIQDLELLLRKTESEKSSKDSQLRAIQEEMNQQDETIAKLNKEKKHQEEVNRKLYEDISAEEDRSNQVKRQKEKLELQMEELEEMLEREKRKRADAEKSKRKTEGELKLSRETNEELNKKIHDMEAGLKAKESDVQVMGVKVEEEQANLVRLQRQIKDEVNRVHELEEELRSEQQARSRADRARAELQSELEEMSDRLEEQARATSIQIEFNKKQDAELAKLRRDLEEANMNHENSLGAMRKKTMDSVSELTEQLEEMQKLKVKTEKERVNLQRQLDDSVAINDSLVKQKTDQERIIKGMEIQLSDFQIKCEEQNRQLQDFVSLRGRLQSENSDLNRQIEDLESQVAVLTRARVQLTTQLEDARRNADEETREKQIVSVNLKNAQLEIEQLKELLEEEGESRAEILRQLSKANAEVIQWKNRFEEEGLVPGERFEEVKRAQDTTIHELREALDSANAKISALEKGKARLARDAEDAQNECARHLTTVTQLDKKQKAFDKIIDEWKKKVDDLNNDLDMAQKDARTTATDLFKERAATENLNLQVEGLKRENKALSQEVKELQSQLSEGGRSVHDMQKIIRRVELEKDELQHALDEAEAALEAEESKVTRAQIEVSQIRTEIEKRIQEKEEEFENTRKNHQQALESMQATLEGENREKAEAVRARKKLETDVNELEINLDHANKANADAQKAVKRYADQVRELQTALEEEQRKREELRQSYNAVERRVAVAQAEKEDLQARLIQVRKSAHVASAHASTVNSNRSKLETEVQLLRSDLASALDALKESEDKLKAAALDSTRLNQQLRIEQENSQHLDKMRKEMELQMRDMQLRLDDAEQAVVKGGQKTVTKLEQRIKSLATDLEIEQRRYQENAKNTIKQERKIREMQFQAEEDKKHIDSLNDLVEKLQNKNRVFKKQLDEAEQLASVNLQKYKQIMLALENAEERADAAENSLMKVRSRTRKNKTQKSITVDRSG